MSFLPDPSVPLGESPEWPSGDGPFVLLADTASRFERRIIEAWARQSAPTGPDIPNPDILRLLPSRRRRPGDKTDPALAARLRRGDDPLVFAARVVWLAPERAGNRTARWVDVLKLGDPRDPDPIRQRVIFERSRDRVRIVLGAPARASELVAAHSDGVEIAGLVEFVTTRAHRTLDRAERQLRGNRYKVPTLVHEEILARAEFRDGVMQIAAETQMPVELAFARARYYLREIAASHSPFLIDLIANAIHWLYTQGYGAILYDSEELASVAALAEEHPIGFVPSHRSNLDRLSLQYLLWENDLPPNHTAAGINMNFFPVGPLIRRTGAFFIRRSFRDKPLYKYVLRSYLEYLIEKRFSLEWYIEGGRSRSGKLLPPKYGMLTWVVEALQRGRAEDFYLIPTSIAYDQIQDVASYAAEAQGQAKQKESVGWVVKAIRSLRRRYGNIHVRFGNPISIAKELGTDFETGEHGIEKLAFTVMYQVGRITPITPTAVTSIALLWDAGRPATADTLAERARRIDEYVEAAHLPTTEPLRLEDPAEVRRVLLQLAEHGSVTVTGAEDEASYHLDAHQALQAAYYRNTIVHFFVPGAIAEIALLAAGDDPERVIPAALDLRDLLKFDFFFADREEFTAHVERELAMIGGDWAQRVADGEVMTLLEHAPLLRSHWAVLPFLDAYQVVADLLIGVGEVTDTKVLLRSCLELGRERLAEGALRSPDGVSQVLFASGLELAANRGLLIEDAGRETFANEIARARARAGSIADLA